MNVRVVPPAAFGQACLAELLGAVANHPSPVIGLPTGNTPVALYSELASMVRDGLDISSWRPFAIDEYGGPVASPCSNRSFFATYWDSIAGSAPVQQFDPEAEDLALESARMVDALRLAGGLTVSLLGIGMNGHLAFNEPGSTVTSSARKVALNDASRQSAKPCWGEDPPTWGLTLGLRELLAARTVIVMANGASKASIVAAAIEGPEDPACPASLVRRANHAIWVLDETAASRLAH